MKRQRLKQAGDRSEVRFDLRNGTLYVANDGKPLSRLGVFAICATDLSEKDPREAFRPDDTLASTSDRDLVIALRDQRLREYRNDSNNLKSSGKREEEASKDYRGRWPWELLQNADDALQTEGAAQIGWKGLGFRAVLEIADDVEIHSPPFNFRLSRKLTADFLSKNDLKVDELSVPHFRVPHPCEHDDIVGGLLADGFSTVVKLGLRPTSAEKCHEVLWNLDTQFLTIAHRIRAVDIQTGNTRRTIRAAQRPIWPASGEIIISDGKIPRNWRRWSHQWDDDAGQVQSVAICIPIGHEIDEPLPLYTHYPLARTIGARAVIHASFEVNQNREDWRARNGSNAVTDERLLATATELLGQIALQIKPQEVLAAFGGLVEPTQPDKGRPDAHLAIALVNMLRTTRFVPTIGGEKLPPVEVRTWSHGLGSVLKAQAEDVHRSALATPAVNELTDALHKLHAKPIGGEIALKLLMHCDASDERKALNTLRCAWGIRFNADTVSSARRTAIR